MLDDEVVSFANTLENASGHPVTFLIDERKGRIAIDDRSVIGITDAKCRALGLYLPPDYAWRCGDYGYYLARQQYPDIAALWMIEYDVRFVGDGLADFFTFFEAQDSIDFLATGYRAADWTWYWALAARGRNVNPHRCLFPVTRLSGRAIDTLLAKRVAHSLRATRRWLWPNDEALVATTLANGSFACRDFNSFGRTFYERATFSYTRPIDGNRLPQTTGELRMLHPVLFGPQYEEKLSRLQMTKRPKSALGSYGRRAIAKYNSLIAW